MPRWKPEPVWEGLDAFIIGGGPSLKTFDWELLRPKQIVSVGTNDAYLHGTEICTVNIFGDIRWWDLHKQGLIEYHKKGGIVFSSCPQLQRAKVKWVWMVERRSSGFHEDALGWCGNTGTNAINLALLLGAHNIYLLGFDMHLGPDGESNYHSNTLNQPDASVYGKFLIQMKNLNAHLEKKFPDRRIFNVTKDSALNVFPKVDLDLFFKERTQNEAQVSHV